MSRTQARRVCGAVWKMKDRPFEVGFREQASNHPKRHRSKAVVVSVGGKEDTGQVWITETSVSEPLMTCRNIFWRRRNQERVPLLGQGWGVPDDGPTGVRHGGGVTVILASIRNVRTCRSDVKGAGQAGSPCKTLSTKAEHRGGAARSVCLTADASGGLKSHSARDPGLISEGGGNASPARRDGRYGEASEARRRKPGHG